jgi:hypothetical protein
MSFGSSKHFDKFSQYYGANDYADRWIQAALSGQVTDFVKGKTDFSAYKHKSRKNVLFVAPKVLNIWMYVVRMMEYAVARCELPCGTLGGSERCDDIPVRAWDQAVAFYSGSLEGTDGDRDGLFLYDLADKMCKQFKTCSANGNLDEGTSSVNLRVMDMFSKGQIGLLKRQCDVVGSIRDQIVNLMTIPLIQASLYSAHVRNFTRTFEEIEGATYSASILPIVHHCNRHDARTIFVNLGLNHSHQIVDAVVVKKAFEHNYDCMGVTCEDIGGVWEGDYYGDYSAPCNLRVEESNQKPVRIGIFVALCFILVPATFAGLLICQRRSRRRRHQLSRRNFCPEQQKQFPDQGGDDDMLATVNID